MDEKTKLDVLATVKQAQQTLAESDLMRAQRDFQQYLLTPEMVRTMSDVFHIGTTLNNYVNSPGMARAISDVLQVGATINNFVNSPEMARAISNIQTVALDVAHFVEAARGHTLPFATAMADVVVMAHHAARTAQQYAAIFAGTRATDAETLATLAAVLAEVDHVRPVLEQYGKELAAAPDERSRRLTMGKAARAIFEGAIGVETSATTPEAWLRFWSRAFFTLLVFTYLQWSASNDRRENRELHRQTAGALVEALKNIQAELHREREADLRPRGPLLRVRGNGSVREGPSSTARRISPLSAGDALELIATVDRWYYVEVLTEDGFRSGHKGWVYRRNTRYVR